MFACRPIPTPADAVLAPVIEKLLNLKNGSGNAVIDRYVRREDTAVRDTFAPTAPGFVIPKDGLEPLLYCLRPGRWDNINESGHVKLILAKNGFLRVRKFGEPSPKAKGMPVSPCIAPLWSIERSDYALSVNCHQVLSFVTDGTALPILTRARDDAKRFAKAADPQPGEEAQAVGIRWVPFDGQRWD